MKRHSRRHIRFFVRSNVVVSFSLLPHRSGVAFASQVVRLPKAFSRSIAAPRYGCIQEQAPATLVLRRSDLHFHPSPSTTASHSVLLRPPPKPSVSFWLPKLPPPPKTLRLLDWDFVPFDDALDARRSISSCTTIAQPVARTD